MNNPFELVLWAVAIGCAWMMLNTFTGLDDWLKRLAGRRPTADALEAKVAALEKRVAQLEAQGSRAAQTS